MGGVWFRLVFLQEGLFLGAETTTKRCVQPSGYVYCIICQITSYSEPIRSNSLIDNNFSPSFGKILNSLCETVYLVLYYGFVSKRSWWC